MLLLRPLLLARPAEEDDERELRLTEEAERPFELLLLETRALPALRDLDDLLEVAMVVEVI